MARADPLPTAAAVLRGVSRLLFHAGYAAQCEVPLANGRRADAVAVGIDGSIIIVEIKVSTVDLRCDRKWPQYLDYCDRFYWAVPPGFPRAPFDLEAFGASHAGLIVADAHDGVILRDAAPAPLSGARRKSMLICLARRAATRLLIASDPTLAAIDSFG